MAFKEEFVIVLDYLSRGYSSSYSGEPIVQAIGTAFFTLFELVPRDGVTIQLDQKLYIGPNERPEIKFIKGKLLYGKLTTSARAELPVVIEQIIKINEPKYTEFFNKAPPISVRKHSLELLPSIGKKHMQNIIEERESKKFENFSDLMERVHLMPDPTRVISERVVQELSDPETKYFLFTPQPRRDR